MLTIVEMPEFERKVKDCLDKESEQDLIEYLAINPEAGDLIQGTGGIRKLRWSESGKGKRGGSRVIYYYHNYKIPVYLITIFKRMKK
ncbi:transcriptional regulator [Thiotrichales bacterium 19S9-12]|nr:transcriptional regulator [Thiotrichales bacterium 19S9-11]MCF6812357.1 transcriptional regulator [Thiotrichales bacterium 19S9-12]